MKKIHVILVSLFIASAIAMSSGCAYLQPPDESDSRAALVKNAGDLAVKYATAKVIQESDNPTRAAERIIAVASLVSSDDEVDADTITKVVHEKIKYASLSPTNKVLVDELLDAIVVELRAQVDARTPDQYRVEVRRVADLVIGVAKNSIA